MIGNTVRMVLDTSSTESSIPPICAKPGVVIRSNVSASRINFFIRIDFAFTTVSKNVLRNLLGKQAAGRNALSFNENSC